MTFTNDFCVENLLVLSSDINKIDLFIFSGISASKSIPSKMAPGISDTNFFSLLEEASKSLMPFFRTPTSSVKLLFKGTITRVSSPRR